MTLLRLQVCPILVSLLLLLFCLRVGHVSMSKPHLCYLCFILTIPFRVSCFSILSEIRFNPEDFFGFIFCLIFLVTSLDITKSFFCISFNILGGFCKLLVRLEDIFQTQDNQLKLLFVASEPGATFLSCNWNLLDWFIQSLG